MKFEGIEKINGADSLDA